MICLLKNCQIFHRQKEKKPFYVATFYQQLLVPCIHWRHCVVSLSKTLLPLLNTDSTQGDPFQNTENLLNAMLNTKISCSSSKMIHIIPWLPELLPFIHEKNIPFLAFLARILCVICTGRTSLSSGHISC